MLQRFLLSTASYRYQLLDNGLRASYDAARNFIRANEPQLSRTSSSSAAMRFIKIAKGYGRASDCRHAAALALGAGNRRSRSGRKRRGDASRGGPGPAVDKCTITLGTAPCRKFFSNKKLTHPPRVLIKMNYPANPNTAWRLRIL